MDFNFWLSYSTRRANFKIYHNYLLCNGLLFTIENRYGKYRADFACQRNYFALVDKGAISSRKSGQALEEILSRINEVTMQINQIAAAAEEQTATTSEVTNNIQQVTDIVQQSARGAEETSSAASQLANQAQQLQSLVSKFRVS